ncbi:hypothetical protein CEUSTIGMA_g13150.t1 [Chlamydomonas eustigma]|uniref:Large ribosomal subunit protein uL3m n=1 Tax=Chlamydomonas eustigma TaxID=1157962 RepID=A0A250XRQ1_9CHLO|nr:hypothetical protein CEUSTIGMA_g13150.t1 [Chlamydomonas eustigma]|eukprot:GAX85735.1 hypothetical protein CEUSTIGMA_g13150.t1 [Chlamydomonas eustigma]
MRTIARLLQSFNNVPYRATSSCEIVTGRELDAHFRFYNTWKYPKRVFKLPANIKSLVMKKVAEAPKIPPFHPPPLISLPMQPNSRRVGAIAVKAGMTQTWDENGVKLPLTVLFIDDCQVIGIKYPEKHGYWALQVGAGYRKQKSISPSESGLYLKLGLPFKHDLSEFRISQDAVLPVGTKVSAAHFVAGQNVDVTGYTKYKGFQGVMKRWGFKGLPASHGVSLAHRSPGSIGNRKSPGKVWKGKKLPGHMGDERRTVHNCLLYKVDAARNLLFVRGQIPGPAGEFVYIRDAISVPKTKKATWGLPFPTYLGELSNLHATLYKSPKDPYRPYAEEADYFPIKWKKGD